VASSSWSLEEARALGAAAGSALHLALPGGNTSDLEQYQEEEQEQEQEQDEDEGAGSPPRTPLAARTPRTPRDEVLAAFGSGLTRQRLTPAARRSRERQARRERAEHKRALRDHFGAEVLRRAQAYLPEPSTSPDAATSTASPSTQPSSPAPPPTDAPASASASPHAPPPAARRRARPQASPPAWGLEEAPHAPQHSPRSPAGPAGSAGAAAPPPARGGAADGVCSFRLVSRGTAEDEEGRRAAGGDSVSSCFRSAASGGSPASGKPSPGKGASPAAAAAPEGPLRRALWAAN
jgi:hypothetical protein